MTKMVRGVVGPTSVINRASLKAMFQMLGVFAEFERSMI